jgi:large subunit ribosomal protein L18
VAASTLSVELRNALQKNAATIEGAKEVGALLARQCRERGIHKVVFDRNGFLYHGRVRALAESVREAGLEF